MNSVIMHNRLSLIVILYGDGFLSTNKDGFPSGKKGVRNKYFLCNEKRGKNNNYHQRNCSEKRQKKKIEKEKRFGKNVP